VSDGEPSAARGAGAREAARGSPTADRESEPKPAETADGALKPTERAPANTLEARLQRLRKSSSFKNYKRVRSRVMQMLLERGAGGRIGAPSAYAAEQLARIEYMFDASPLIVAKLREHCHHVTGVGVNDYRPNDPEAKREVRRKLKLLAPLGRSDLLVPEPKLLGGFGAHVGGDLHNADSLGYHESLVAMARGSVLSHPRQAKERWTVWEIGAGWGGFAYQFKTLFPKVTYVISDLPGRFLLSGTYLMNAFPEASFAFYEDDADIKWWKHDFVFIPNTALEAVSPARIDLTISVRSFEEMTTAQVDSYVAHAYDRGCPYLYNFSRDRAPGNAELDSVHDVIARYYWPHEVEMPSLKPQAGDRATGRDGGSAARYRHVIGWRRVQI
jgi:hypothetical protein